MDSTKTYDERFQKIRNDLDEEINQNPDEITLESFDKIVKLGDEFIAIPYDEGAYQHNDIFVDILRCINKAKLQFKANNFNEVSDIIDNYIKKDEEIRKESQDNMSNKMAELYRTTFQSIKKETNEIKRQMPKYIIKKPTPWWGILLIVLIVLLLIPLCSHYNEKLEATV